MSTTIRRAATALTSFSLSMLALTACDPGSADAAAPEKTTTVGASAPKQSGSASTGGTASATPTRSSTSEGSGEGSTGGQAPSEGDVPTCRSNQLKLTVTPVSRPVNHALITATNASHSACRIPRNQPVVTFDELDGQADLMGKATSSETALEVGKSAYAALMLSRADQEGGKTVQNVNIALTADAQPTAVQIAGNPLVINDPQVSTWYATSAEALLY
ncbi:MULTISPECIES: DUF4232 domain-containing protein [Streptomyces]|uniref:DUF4232 domain-containing protein n=1 Tax=Streptomyces herbicida TaxID=3065675 RepID=UPI00292E88B8|nr:DUF4232 domain-containing protein [Streptomyces sp. NEAU-HV9]